MSPYLYGIACLLMSAAPALAQSRPPLVGEVNFEDTPAGMETGIAKDRYRQLGVTFGCTPGHWLHTVERAGGHFGRSLAISPGGDDLYISVEFVQPGTRHAGIVQATDIQVLDAGGIGYEYEYFAVNGSLTTSDSNHGDYRIGENWHYAHGPVAYRVVVQVGDGTGIFLDNIRFSTIASGAVGVTTHTWSAIRGLYR